MNKFKKSHVLMLFLLAITPLISSSLRSSYLYFISNIIIITLSAEAGLFSVFLKPLEDRKQSPSIIQQSPLEDKSQFPSVPQEPLLPLEASSEKREASTIVSEHVEKKLKLVESLETEKAVSVTKVDKVQKGPPRSSIFFIGNGEDDAEGVMEEEIIEAVEEDGGVNGKELFAKAEAFIGLFYKQLKMQREEPWTA